MSPLLSVGGVLLITSVGTAPPEAPVAKAHLTGITQLESVARATPSPWPQRAETPTAETIADRLRARYASLEYLEFRSLGSFEIIGSMASENGHAEEAETHRTYPPTEAFAQMSHTSVRLHLRYNEGESESIVMVHEGRGAEVTNRLKEGSFERLRRTLEEDEYLWETYADTASVIYQLMPEDPNEKRHADFEANFVTGITAREFYPPEAFNDPSASLELDPDRAILTFEPSGPAGAADWFFFEAPGCNFGAQLQTWIGPHCSIDVLFDRIAEADSVVETWKDGRRIYRVTHSMLRRGASQPTISEFDIDAELWLLSAWRQERPQLNGLTIHMGSEFSRHRTTPPEEGVVWMIEHEPGKLLQIPDWRE